jgi:hypothetical protein
LGLLSLSQPALAQTAAFTVDEAAAERLWTLVCAACHGQGRAPQKERISRSSAVAIMDAMQGGVMGAATQFLSFEERLNIALWLSGERSPGQEAAGSPG